MKNWLSILALVFFPLWASAQSSLTISVPGTAFCANTNLLPVAISFSDASTTYLPGNTFHVQLSNAQGTFTNPLPVNIGSVQSQASSGTIQAIIPTWIAAGANYRMRIIATSPFTIGNDNGTDIRIDNQPQVTVSSAGGICQSGAVQLTATGAATYSWSPAATLSNTTGAVVTATPAISTFYTVTGTNTCGSETTTFQAGASQLLFKETMGTVLTNTTVAAHENSNGFDNDQLTFSTWNSATLQSSSASAGYPGASGGAHVKLNPASPNTYPVFTAGGINLKGHNGIRVSFGVRKSSSSSNGSTLKVVLSSNNYSQQIGIPPLPTNAGGHLWYYVTVTFNQPTPPYGHENAELRFFNEGTNVTYFLDDIVVSSPNPLPQITPTGPINVCTGTNLALTASSASSYSWSNGATTQVNIVNQGGTYSVTTTDAAGCIRTSAPVTVTMAGPSVPVLSNNGPLCEGQTLQLSATGNPSWNYSWSGFTSNGYWTSNVQNPTLNNITLLSGGSFHLTVTIPGCGVFSDSTMVAVGTPSFSALIQGDSTICQGQNLELQGYTVTSSGYTLMGATFSWAGPNGFTSNQQFITLPNATPANSGNYTVTATSGCGTATEVINVQVSPTPATPQPSTSGSVCNGQPLQFSANGNYPAGTSFSWTNNFNFTSTLQNPVMANTFWVNSDPVSLIVTTNGCSSAPGIVNPLIFHPSPNPFLESNMPVCPGSALMLTASGWNPAYQFTWTGPNNFSATGNLVTIPDLQAAHYGTYTITTGLPGCAGLSTLTVGQPTGPQAHSNSPICPGSFLTLFADTIWSGATYSWVGPNGFTSTLQNPVLPFVTTADAGNYSVYAGYGGCLSLPTIVPVSITNNVTLAITGNTALDQGATLYLNAAGPTGNYTWTGPNGFTGIGPNIYIQHITPANAGIYTVTFDAPGCNLGSATVNVTVNPLNVITGVVYYDLNNNNTFDAGDTPVPNEFIHSSQFQYGAGTNSGGEYFLYVPDGTYTLDVWGMQSAPPTHTVTVAGNQLTAGHNFALIPPLTTHNLMVSIAEGICAIPGDTTLHHLAYNNLGSSPVTVTLKYLKDPALTLISSGGNFTFSGDTLIWTYPNLQPNQTAYTTLQFLVSAGTVLGSTLSSSVSIDPVFGDLYPANNYFTLSQTVVGSFDPNDKLVQPAGAITEQEVATGMELFYTIRFQNTGTAPAQNILLADTLSTNLNWNTFQMLAASHHYNLNVRENGILEWHFPNIMLPDSGANQSESHGYVQFRIMPKSTLVNGDHIFNRAHIFFDFNEAVITNTTHTPVGILAAPEANNANLLQLFPNPNSGQATLRFTAANAAETTVFVLNLLGQEVWHLKKATEGGEVEIAVDLQNQPAGIYLVRVQHNGKVYSAKAIRQ